MEKLKDHRFMELEKKNTSWLLKIMNDCIKKTADYVRNCLFEVAIERLDLTKSL